jgi:hypothetical protein
MAKLFLLLLFIPFLACSQLNDKDAEQEPKRLMINPSVINGDSLEVKDVLATWLNYLKTKDSLYLINPYWSTEEYNRRKLPDSFFKDLNHSVFFNEKNYYKPTVIAVEKIDNSYFLKTLFASSEKDDGYTRLAYIINVEVIRENNNWKLKSMLDRNLLENYNYRKEGNIHYYYYKDKKIDLVLCSKFNIENIKIAEKFGINPLTITYFLCKNNREAQRLKGFDFEPSMYYSNQVSGLIDAMNTTIYAGNNSEWYLHELVHLYVYNVFGADVNHCFNEGVATYFGGSVGYPLEYHLKKLAIYVKKNSVNFLDLPSLERIDDYTNFQYTIGGLFCKIMHSREGMTGVFKLLRCGSSDEDLYNTIEQVVGVKRENLNEFILNELKKYE